MHRTLVIVLVSLFAAPIRIQIASAQTQQVIQVECRDLGQSGSYLAPNETVINGRACRPAGTPLQTINPDSKTPIVSSTSAAAPSIPLSAATPGTLGAPQESAQATPTGFLLEDGTPVEIQRRYVHQTIGYINGGQEYLKSLIASEPGREARFPLNRKPSVQMRLFL